jgi:predicted MPP superfamily phosphohydrolase
VAADAEPRHPGRDLHGHDASAAALVASRLEAAIHRERAKPLSRRQFIGGAAALAATGVAAETLFLEPRRVALTRHTIATPDGMRSVRVAQLSDLHLHSIGAHEQRIAQVIHQAAPDVILHTGDAVDRADALPLLDEFLQMLPKVEASFAILGNWEYWGQVDLRALDTLYARHDVQLLVNRSVVSRIFGRSLTLTGLDDLIGGKPDTARAFADIEQGAPGHIVLAHCPAHREVLWSEAPGRQSSAPSAEMPHRPIVLLAGHTHGGQVCIGGWAPVRPRGSGRYVSGWYRDATIPMYVSRGLGTSIVHARLGSVPEVAVFDA